MRLALTYLRIVLAGMLLTYLPSCSHHSTELSPPIPTLASSKQVQEITIAEAQNWYQTNYPSTFTSSAPKSGTSLSATITTGTTSLAGTKLLWTRTLTIGQGAQKLILVPLAGDQSLFAGRDWQGIRYLIINKSNNRMLNGNLLEFIVRRNTEPIDTAALFAKLYYSHGGNMAAPNQGESYVFLYSPNYQYLVGKHFRGGRLLAGNAHLKFFPTGTTSQARTGSPTSQQVSSLATTVDLPTAPTANATNGGVCTDWYNADTGEYITTTGDCYTYGGGGGSGPINMPDLGGGDSGPGGYGGGSGAGGSGGGGSGGNTPVPTSNSPVSGYGRGSDGSYSVVSTSDTQNNTPPADCGSWQFRAVGPGGYMACGVADIRIDVWQHYIDAAGEDYVGYFNFGFDTYNIYFEMPPAYTSGQAATLCAQLKDAAESYIEDKYSGVPITQADVDVISNDFYTYLSGLMRGVGGRLAKQANYPNTPVRPYSETLFPNNGGCS